MVLAPQHKIDDYTARGWWGTQTLGALFERHRRERPQEEAVVDAPNRADLPTVRRNASAGPRSANRSIVSPCCCSCKG